MILNILSEKGAYTVDMPDDYQDIETLYYLDHTHPITVIAFLLSSLPNGKVVMFSNSLSDEECKVIAPLIPAHVYVGIHKEFKEEIGLALIKMLNPNSHIMVINHISIEFATKLALSMPKYSYLTFHEVDYSPLVQATILSLKPETGFIVSTSKENEIFDIAKKINRSCRLRFIPNIPVETQKMASRVHAREVLYVPPKKENTITGVNEASASLLSKVGHFGRSNRSAFSPLTNVDSSSENAMAIKKRRLF